MSNSGAPEPEVKAQEMWADMIKASPEQARHIGGLMLSSVMEPEKFAETFGKLGWTRALIIAGPEVETNFGLAARNIPHVDVLPNAGLNVYDILRADKLVLTKAAVEAIEARFSEKEAV